jgi:hypothetical protein
MKNERKFKVIADEEIFADHVRGGDGSYSREGNCTSKELLCSNIPHPDNIHDIKAIRRLKGALSDRSTIHTLDSTQRIA